MPREFRSYRVEAIVLRHQDWGEADRILTLYTRQEGKVRAIAKGARKIRSRKAGHLEPFTHVSLQLAKAREMPIITQAETIQGYLDLREDLISITLASYIVELLDKFSYEEGDNVPLFNLLDKTLARLANPTKFPDRNLVLRYYEMRLLDLVGFRPELTLCVVCGEPIQAEDQFFSAKEGGVVCPSCSHGVEGLRPVRKDVLRYLRHTQRSNFSETARAHPAPEIHQEMENLMTHYLTYVLEQGLNTPKFLRRITE